jgi:hypothetical protein
VKRPKVDLAEVGPELVPSGDPANNEVTQPPAADLIQWIDASHETAVVGQRAVTYTWFMVSPSRQSFDAEAVRRKERLERAARVAAMFERWATEDTSDEPEWDVDQVPRIEFRTVETANTKPER